MTVQGTDDDFGVDDSSDNLINNITSEDDGENIQTNDDSTVVKTAHGPHAQLACTLPMVASVKRAGDATDAVTSTR